MRRTQSIPELIRFDVKTDDGLRRFNKGLMLGLAEHRVGVQTARFLADLARKEHDYEQGRRFQEESRERMRQMLEVRDQMADTEDADGT